MLNAVEMMIFLASILGTFFWCRSESREDQRRSEDRMNALVEAIHLEMKDFHGRLCALEEKSKGK